MPSFVSTAPRIGGLVALLALLSGVAVGSQAAPEDLDRERDLRGRVLDVGGRPLEGAELELVRLKWRGHDLDTDPGAFEAGRERHATDARGEFRIPLEPDAEYDLAVSRGDLAPELVTAVRAGAFLEVVLQPPASFEGRVTAEADGAPIAGALVRGRTVVGRSEVIFSGTTAADGGFRFDDLPLGLVRVEVVPPAHAAPPWPDIELVGGETTRREFRCPAGTRLFGTVTDARMGEPLAGATVGQGATFTKAVVTNARGEYELAHFALEGHGDVFVRAPGHGTVRKAVSASSDSTRLDLALLPSRRITGRILRPDGAPAPDVSVAAITAARPSDPNLLNWIAGRVDSDGTFVIEELDWDGHYAIAVRSAEFAHVVYELPQRAKSVPTFELDPIRLDPPATVRGVVRDEEGKPVANAWVRFGDHNQNLRERFRLAEGVDQTVNETFTQRDARTDDRGRFTFTHLRPGPGCIDVLVGARYLGPTRYQSQFGHARQVDLRSGEVETDVDIVLSRRGD